MTIFHMGCKLRHAIANILAEISGQDNAVLIVREHSVLLNSSYFQRDDFNTKGRYRYYIKSNGLAGSFLGFLQKFNKNFEIVRITSYF